MNQAGRLSMMRGKRLPYKKRVEYLESTGTQYIMTDIRLKDSMTFEIGVDALGSSFCRIFGGRRLTSAAGNETDSAMFSCSSSVGLIWDYGTGYGHDRIQVSSYRPWNGEIRNFRLGNRYVYDMDNGTYIVQNSVVSFTERTIPITLFAVNQQDYGVSSPTVMLSGPLKVSLFRMYDGGELKNSLTPVIDLNDEPKMFDLVTNDYPTHYGSFVAGPDL